MTIEAAGRGVAIAGAPPIDGLAFRAFRPADDYPAVAGLVQACSVHDGEDWIPSPETLRVEWENSTDFVPARDVVLAEVDGQLVAYGLAYRQVRDGVAVYTTGGSVLPRWRRHGLGRAILRHNEGHLRAIAAGFADHGGRTLGAWTGDREGGARELLTGEGYLPVRWFRAMIRPSLGDAAALPLPEGLEIRPVEEAHHRAIFDADAEAFRDHWGHQEPTEEDFRMVFTMPGIEPSLWRVAWDGDEVAGSVQTYVFRTENEVLGVNRAWLERISVRRRWRRRGLATALIGSALVGLREAGVAEAMLGVDADNPNGALGLYESLGFVVKDRATTWRKAW